MKQSICQSYLLELTQGIHVWGVDQFKLALYGDAAVLDYTTAAYTAAGEIAGTGYVAGGFNLALTAGYPKLDPNAQAGNPRVLIDFADINVDPAAFTTRYGLIYNSSKQNRAVAVLDFGQDYVSTASFVLAWPDPGGINSQAILRLGA